MLKHRDIFAPVFLSLSIAGCTGPGGLTLKPYDIILAGALTSTEEPVPDFGAFAVEEGQDGRFNADADVSRVFHVLAMVERDNRLYALFHRLGHSWMYSVDVEDPTEPTLLNAFGNRFQAPDSFALAGGFLLGLGTGFSRANDIQVYDLTDPLVPDEIGGAQTTEDVSGSSVSGDLVALRLEDSSTRSVSWAFYRIDDGGALTWIATPQELESCGRDSTLHHEVFYCTPDFLMKTENTPVSIYDLSDVVAPNLINNFSRDVDAFTMSDHFAFIVSTPDDAVTAVGSLYIWDVQNVLAPVLVDSHDWSFSGWGLNEFNIAGDGSGLRFEDGVLIWKNALQHVEPSGYGATASLVVSVQTDGSVGEVSCFSHFDPFAGERNPYSNAGSVVQRFAVVDDSLVLGTVGGGLQSYRLHDISTNDCSQSF